MLPQDVLYKCLFYMLCYYFFINSPKAEMLPRDFEILGWCPAGTFFSHGEKLALVGHPSSDGITIKMPYGVDVLHRPASHPIFSYWVG